MVRKEKFFKYNYLQTFDFSSKKRSNSSVVMGLRLTQEFQFFFDISELMHIFLHYLIIFLSNKSKTELECKYLEQFFLLCL